MCGGLENYQECSPCFQYDQMYVKGTTAMSVIVQYQLKLIIPWSGHYKISRGNQNYCRLVTGNYVTVWV